VAQNASNELIQRLKAQIKEKESQIGALNESLEESKKQIEDFNNVMSSPSSKKESTPKTNAKDRAMIQQYMKENKVLKQELEGALADIKDLEENGGKMPQGKQRRSSVIPPMLQSCKGALIDVETIMEEMDSEESLGDSKLEEMKAELQAASEEKINELKKQMESLKKTNKKSDSELRLKTAEIAQMKKELKTLRQAKELCETLHIFDDEEDLGDGEADDIVEELVSPASNTMTARSNNDTASGDGTGKTTARSMNSTAKRSSMKMKQQKAIADMIKSRDEAEQKVTKIRDRVSHLEKTNKKLNKTIKSLNKEIVNLKENATLNVPVPDQLDPSIGAPTDISSDRTSSQRISENDDVPPLKSDRTSTKSTARRMSRRPSSRMGITERSQSASNGSVASNGSTRTQSASIRNGTAETDRSSRRASRRSYSVAPPSVAVEDLGNLTLEDLKREIKKLKEELVMWRKIRQKDDGESCDTLRAKYGSKSAGLGQHKPLMANKPKLKQPKAKHRVEKKWKMTKSRFLDILKGEHTKRSLKSKRWILKTLNEIFDSKYKSDKNCLRENRAILALPEFIYHEYIPSRFGIKNLVDAMCWDIHKAVEHYSESSRKSGISEEEYKEIVIFKRFLEEDLSLNDLSFYLKARKVLVESKTLLLEGGFIPFKCINVLLDNIFDGTFKEYRLGISLKLQATALLQSDNGVIHKDLFLDFILKENQYLLHEFEASVQSLYFHFNLNNKDIIKREDSTRALQYILKGLPTKSMDEIINVIQSSDNNNDVPPSNPTDDMQSMQSFFIKPYVQFCNISRNLFAWKQQFFVPNFSYNNNLIHFNFEVMRAVSTRWNEFKGNMIVPILEMFEKHSNAYCVLNANKVANTNNIKDLLGITKVICRIRDYFEDMDRLIALCMGWDVFMLYTAILSAIIQGFEILDQYELKRLISKQDLNQTQCTKAVDNYLYLYEDYVMKRLRRAVSAKRTGSASGTISTPNNAALSQYLHLKQQVLQN